MKHHFLITVLLFPVLSGSMLVHAQRIDKYDIVWNSPSRDAAGSMPCGGGDIGLNVWVEKGDLLLYLSRSGTFDENNTFLKLGRLRLRLSPNPLEGGKFRQELILKDGSILLEGASSFKTAIKIWVDVHRAIVHMDLTSTRPVTASATYESWRTADQVVNGKANNANSYKWAPQRAPGGQVITHHDSISFRNQCVLFYHRNQPGNTEFDVTVHQQGLDSVKTLLNDPLKNLTFGGLLMGSGLRPAGIVHGKYLDTEFTGWKLSSHKPARTTHIALYLATAQTATLAAWQDSLQDVIEDGHRHEKDAALATSQWWQDFWNRSFIDIEPADKADTAIWQAGRNYQLFRYMLGCNAYGQYPTKFNGGLFTFDPSLTNKDLPFTPDFRNWGGGTMTAQNQRLVYWPLLKSGDFELMHPQFEFYLRSLRAAELRTAIYWGHKGACFTEQIENFGLPNPSEYGWDMPADHDKGVEYNAWLEYEWDTVLEFCLMMLETERYAGKDIHAYLPFIESCLRFFNEHYQQQARRQGRKTLDGNGDLILYPGSAGETYKMAYNSTSTIAALHTVLTRLLELPADYLAEGERKEWATMLDRLPPISYRSFEGHVTIAPARVWQRVNNQESMQLYPVFPWGIYGVGKPGLDTALNTWKYDTDCIKFRSYVGWKQDNIFAARLGLADDAARLTVQKLQDGPCRFPAFWGPGFDWLPDHNWGGSGMIGLQEMLLQTDGKKILLFPAWPKGWNVHFKLYAPYNTTVEATFKDGKVTQLNVLPEQRMKDVISCF